MKKKPVSKPPPRPLESSELRTVIGGYGVGNSGESVGKIGGIHPNPPVGPGG